MSRPTTIITVSLLHLFDLEVAVRSFFTAKMYQRSSPAKKRNPEVAITLQGRLNQNIEASAMINRVSATRYFFVSDFILEVLESVIAKIAIVVRAGTFQRAFQGDKQTGESA
jgi:hypothetical protein